MNFHWMFGNAESMSDQYLIDFFKKIDAHGYFSVLLPYDPYLGDWIMRIFKIIDNETQIKYMFALRTYAISPEYTAMMFNTFEEFFPGRAMINVLAGDKTQMARESSMNPDLNAALLEQDFFTDPFKRIAYTDAWLDKFTNLSILKSKPAIAITGTSDQTLNNVRKYGDYSGCMIYSYLEDKDRYTFEGKPCLVVAALLVAKDKEEYDNYSNLMKSDPSANSHYTIFGYKHDIINKIDELKNMGMTDLMLTKHHFMENENLIHEVVREYSGDK